MRKRIHRRTLLRGAGGVAVALPTLSAMESRAQSAPVQRFVAFLTPIATIQSAWFPTGTESSFDLAPTLLAPLNPYKSKLIILKGVDYQSSQPQLGDSGKGDGHTRVCGTMLTGQYLQTGD